MLNQVNSDIKGIAQDLERHPARHLFDDDISKGLDNLLKDILCPGPGSKNNPFFRKGGIFGKRGKNEKENVDDKQSSLGGMMSQSTWRGLKNFGLVAGTLLSLLIIYLITKKQLKGTT